MRDILETDRVDNQRSEEILSHLENECEVVDSVPIYKAEQEAVLKYTISEERESIDLRGTVQIELYQSGQIKGIGDRFIIENYFPERSYI